VFSTRVSMVKPTTTTKGSKKDSSGEDNSNSDKEEEPEEVMNQQQTRQVTAEKKSKLMEYLILCIGLEDFDSLAEILIKECIGTPVKIAHDITLALIGKLEDKHELPTNAGRVLLKLRDFLKSMEEDMLK
jgi:hypothetical protein